MHTNNEPVAAEKRSQDSNASVIAYRKRCDADGVGLSHYILMDKRSAYASEPSVLARRKPCSSDDVGPSQLIDNEQKA